MKMDILSWTKLAPTIKIVDTKKKFFNNYLYKIVVNVPGGRFILSKDTLPMSTQIANFRNLVSSRGKGPTSWNSYAVSRALHRINRIDPNQLEYFKSIVGTHKDKIKVRVEEPKICIYSNDEQLLIQLTKKYRDDLLEIHRPANDRAIEILDRGEIIVKNNTDYEYKVLFRESGQFDTDTRTQVYNYLTSQGDAVKLTKSCEKNLKFRNYWFTQTYFYTNDPNIMTFLNIIAPGAVTGIFKLTKIDQ
jgi:glutathione peroxidase-family protein